MASEYLPICDVLFNVVSLALYFCNVVFDLVSAYTFLKGHEFVWFGVCITFVLTSLFISQIISLVWHLQQQKFHCQQRELWLKKVNPTENVYFDNLFVIVIHFLQLGVVWRYCKLFLPVHISSAKVEIRNLCTIRMIHAFIESAPVLMLQLHLIWQKPTALLVTDLNILSSVLALFNICWALASYGKHMRHVDNNTVNANEEDIVLTWPGILSQFFWRLGMISARLTSLTVYASLFTYWLFLVMGAHWTCMFAWLTTQQLVFFHAEMSMARKRIVSALTAWTYIFGFVNVEDGSSRQRIIAFYFIMFLENSLLFGVWFRQKTVTNEIVWFHYPALGVVLVGFVVGVLFMMLYYRFFHIRKLQERFGLSAIRQERLSSLPCNTPATHAAAYTDCRQHSPRANHTATVTCSRTYSKPVEPAQQINSDASSLYHERSGTNLPQGIFNCQISTQFKNRGKQKKSATRYVPSPNSSYLPPPARHPQPQPFWRKGADSPNTISQVTLINPPYKGKQGNRPKSGGKKDSNKSNLLDDNKTMSAAVSQRLKTHSRLGGGSAIDSRELVLSPHALNRSSKDVDETYYGFLTPQEEIVAKAECRRACMNRRSPEGESLYSHRRRHNSAHTANGSVSRSHRRKSQTSSFGLPAPHHGSDGDVDSDSPKHRNFRNFQNVNCQQQQQLLRPPPPAYPQQHYHYNHQKARPKSWHFPYDDISETVL